MYCRKQITFDLDTGILKEIHGEKNYTKAYSDIRSFMENNDFEHIEGSVYASQKPIEDLDVLGLIKDLKQEHEYLDKCVRNMHQADIGESHSLSDRFSYDGTAGKFAQKQQENSIPPNTNAETDISENKSVNKNTIRSNRFISALSLTSNIQVDKSDITDLYNK